MSAFLPENPISLFALGIFFFKFDFYLFYFVLFCKWLEETFLKYINDWKEETDRMVDFPKDLRRRFCLSHQTIVGLRITGNFINYFIDNKKKIER